MPFVKIISNTDLTIRDQNYSKYESQIIELATKVFGYQNKFETGYGWLLNAAKLRNHGIISATFFDELSKWFYTEFKQGQQVSIEVWEDYCNLDTKIRKHLSYLLSNVKSDITF